MEKELSRLTRLIQAEILAWDHTILAQFSEMQFRFEALLERPSHLSSIYRSIARCSMERWTHIGVSDLRVPRLASHKRINDIVDLFADRQASVRIGCPSELAQTCLMNEGII